MPEEEELHEEDVSPGEIDEPAMTLEEPEPEEPQLLASLPLRRRQVEMQNPWGREEPKSTNGRPRDGNDDGRFTLSKDAFIDTFDWLGVEQPPRMPGGGR
ncbi:MAG: hypothetical protein KME03_07400 [Aphanocapsa lilacina HA4352-LM1]|jgi:hypothetical protein|nr:hypothetical protein [Aphanocapsa lilacina HA4352-LM1]